MSKLTAIHVRNAKTKSKPYKLTDGYGMFLHVAKSGKKTWRYRYRIAGKESTFVIGEYPLMSLEQARGARVEAREKVKQGINPSKYCREKRQTAMKDAEVARDIQKNTFEFIAMEWIEQQRERWSRDHAGAVLATLKADAFPAIGNTPVDTIIPLMILQVVRNIENRGAFEIAHKVLQRINAVFRYAVQTGRITHNPAGDMKGVLKTRKVTHRAALTQEALIRGDIHTNHPPCPTVYHIDGCQEWRNSWCDLG